MKTSFSSSVTSCSFLSSAPTSGGTATLSSLLDWLKLLVAEDIPLEALQSKDDKVAVPPLVGALLKNEQDVSLFEKLVFMQRNNR